MLGITEKDINLSEIKNNYIDRVKLIARGALDDTDWKVLRHLDEVELGVETSFNNSEYMSLLNNRRSVRTWSNNKEISILGASSLYQVENIDLSL